MRPTLMDERLRHCTTQVLKGRTDHRAGKVIALRLCLLQLLFQLFHLGTLFSIQAALRVQLLSRALHLLTLVFQGQPEVLRSIVRQTTPARGISGAKHELFRCLHIPILQLGNQSRYFQALLDRFTCSLVKQTRPTNIHKKVKQTTTSSKAQSAACQALDTLAYPQSILLKIADTSCGSNTAQKRPKNLVLLGPQTLLHICDFTRSLLHNAAGLLERWR